MKKDNENISRGKGQNKMYTPARAPYSRRISQQVVSALGKTHTKTIRMQTCLRESSPASSGPQCRQNPTTTVRHTCTLQLVNTATRTITIKLLLFIIYNNPNLNIMIYNFYTKSQKQKLIISIMQQDAFFHGINLDTYALM